MSKEQEQLPTQVLFVVERRAGLGLVNGESREKSSYPTKCCVSSKGEQGLDIWLTAKSMKGQLPG